MYRVTRSLVLTIILLSSLTLSGAGRTVFIPPFRVDTVRDFPELGLRVARLLGFRLQAFPGIQIRYGASARAAYRISGHIRLTPHNIEFKANLYKKGNRFPLSRYTATATGAGEVYRLVEAASCHFAPILPGGKRRPARPRTLDLALCLNLSGSMASLVADLPRAILETLNMLERTVPFHRYRIALVLYRAGTIIKTIPFTSNRSRILNALGKPSAWTPPGKRDDIRLVLRKVAGLSWSGGAGRVLVLYSNQAGSEFTDSASALYKQRGIRILHVAAPRTGAGYFKEKAALKILAEATGGVSLTPPTLLSWIQKGRGLSLLWDRGRVYLFNRRIRPDALPLLRPEADRIPSRTRTFRAETLPNARRIGRVPRSHSTTTGLARAIHRGLALILRRQGLQIGADRIAGRLLLESGGVRFWWDTTDHKFFKKIAQYAGGAPFWMGIHPVPAPHRQLRFTAHPGLFHLPAPGSRIPGLAEAGIGRLTAKPEFYSSTGIFSPSRWYLRVRLLKTAKGQTPLSSKDF